MDKAQFSIDDYLKKLNDIFNQKQKSLNIMKERLVKFNNLLKDEEIISQKIKKICKKEDDLFDLTNDENLIQQDILLDELDY